MQQPEEAAAEAEAERRARLHLEREARIVEPQLAHRGAQILELRGIDRKQAAEHDRDRRLEAGEHLLDRLAIVGDRVADARVGHLLDRGRHEPDLAGAELIRRDQLGREHADAVDVVRRIRAHHADALALLQHAIDDAHQHDDAEIEVVPAVDQQRLQGGGAVALGRRQARDDRFQHGLDVLPGLGRNLDRVGGIEPDHVLDLLLHLGGLGRRQVHLVEHRHDLMAGIDRVIDVGERLRLDALDWHRPPAASPRRRRGSGSPHRRNRHARACRSGSGCRSCRPSPDS